MVPLSNLDTPFFKVGELYLNATGPRKGLEPLASCPGRVHRAFCCSQARGPHQPHWHPPACQLLLGSLVRVSSSGSLPHQVTQPVCTDTHTYKTRILKGCSRHTGESNLSRRFSTAHGRQVLNHPVGRAWPRPQPTRWRDVSLQHPAADSLSQA